MRYVRVRSFYCGAFFVILSSVIVGCGKSPQAEFRMNMPVLLTNGLTDFQRQTLADTLGAMFGTPDAPFAPAESGLDGRKLALAAGTVRSDIDGGKHGLYRRHCAHCHGITGDGRGPTAMTLNPYPRDYRPGIFKFKSTPTAAKPSDADLKRVLMEGIPGTAMPAFNLLPEDEVEALIEYVKYLGMRGETEIKLAQYAALEMFDDDDQPIPFEFKDDLELKEVVLEEAGVVFEQWAEANEQAVRPDLEAIPSPERTEEELAASIAAGRELFYGAKANCLKCHGPTALGDGQADDWNIWNKNAKEFIETTESIASSIDEDTAEMDADERDAAYQNLALRQAVASTLFPVRNAIPRNLRQGVYRGGRRPLDLFWRLHEGINGTPMPAVGNTLTEEQIWQVVDYVRSLPYEPASKVQHQLPANARERL